MHLKWLECLIYDVEVPALISQSFHMPGVHQARHTCAADKMKQPLLEAEGFCDCW